MHFYDCPLNAYFNIAHIKPVSYSVLQGWLTRNRFDIELVNLIGRFLSVDKEKLMISTRDSENGFGPSHSLQREN